jgi:hypothetical protein
MKYCCAVTFPDVYSPDAAAAAFSPSIMFFKLVYLMTLQR